MTSTISLPVWLFAVIVALAVFAAVDEVFLPGMRWHLRRRVNRAIAEVNARFGLELPTFQLTTRRVPIDRLVFDPEVMRTVGAVAAERGVERERLMAEVSSIAREMAPAFNACFYFKPGYWIARRLLRGFHRVRLGFAHERAAAKAPPDTAMVFFINHRSNVDYMLVTYLAARSVALSCGAGEWARVWPLRSLLRLAGVYNPAPRVRRPDLSQGAGSASCRCWPCLSSRPC